MGTAESPDAHGDMSSQMSFEGVPRTDPSHALTRGRLASMYFTELIATAKAGWDDVAVLEMVLLEARQRISQNTKSKAREVVEVVEPRLAELRADENDLSSPAESESATDPTQSWMIDLKLTNHPQHPGGWFAIQTHVERRFECSEDDALMIHTNLLNAVAERLSEMPPAAPPGHETEPLRLEWDNAGRYSSISVEGPVKGWAIDAVLLRQSPDGGFRVHTRREHWFRATAVVARDAYLDIEASMIGLLPDGATDLYGRPTGP